MSATDARMQVEDRIAQPPGQTLKDYILTEYAPNAALEGKLCSVSVLRYFLRTTGLSGVWPIVQRAREVLGEGETVWGVKYGAGGAPQVELYFYNHAGNGKDNPKSITRLVNAFAPVLRIDSRSDERTDYFMVSLELDAEVLARGHSEGLRMYVRGRGGRHDSDGTSYLITADALVRENHYNFYRAAEGLDAVRDHLRRSLRSGDENSQRALLAPELCDCFTICFATKRFSDALYFSRISTTQLLAFTARHMAGDLDAMLHAHAAELAHLRWDVGLDFCSNSFASASARVVKAGLYGFV